MKTTRALKGSFFAVAALLAGLPLGAQNVQFINITRSANYFQTTDSTVSSGTLIADPTTPFVFRAGIEGDSGVSDGNPIFQATTSYTPPGGSATGLIYNSSGHQWRFTDTSQTSMANINSVYGTGTYNFTINGTPSAASVTVGSFASSQLQTPILTLSGGTWVGNTYQLIEGATLTVQFNAVYSGTVGGTASFHYDAEVNGVGNQNINDFINYDAMNATSATYTSTPPNWTTTPLSAGPQTLQVSYEEVQNPGPSGYASAFGASLLEFNTTINLQVIPEPSTYAAIFGVVALGGVMFHRRRRMAA